MKRTLSLKRESLAELTSGDLAAVAGAAGQDARYSGQGLSCPLRACIDLSNLVSCYACVAE